MPVSDNLQSILTGILEDGKLLFGVETEMLL